MSLMSATDKKSWYLFLVLISLYFFFSCKAYSKYTFHENSFFLFLFRVHLFKTKQANERKNEVRCQHIFLLYLFCLMAICWFDQYRNFIFSCFLVLLCSKPLLKHISKNLSIWSPFLFLTRFLTSLEEGFWFYEQF